MTAKAISYKKTGLDWMPEMPEHWEIKRLGALFEERNETVSENDYMPLSVTMQGIVPQLESAAKTMHVDNRKLVCVGDFAINSRSDRRGSGGLSLLNGSVSIINTVLKPSRLYIPEYTHFLLTNRLFQDEYYAKGKGIVADMWSTKFSDLKTIYLPVPPKPEQDAIVQYIKAKEEKINRFIEKKKCFIELLKEQRRNIINHSVTNGINSNSRVKESGYDWLGEIPQHWEVRRLKNIGKTKYGLGQPPREKEGGLPLIRATNVDSGFILEKELVFVDPTDIPWERDPVLKTNDIIIVRSGALTGDSAIITQKYEGAITGYDMVFETQVGNAEFVAFYLLSPFALSQIYLLRQRAAQPHLNKEQLENLIIALPPLEEQKQIVSHIKTETATIDTAIAKAEREIELIREYKEAMISEAVMGKMKIIK